MDEKSELIEMTADIVSAYVGNNSVATGDLPALIQSIYRALNNISGVAEPEPVAPKEPAVPVRRSITPEHLICLEDGRKFKSLKRHLRTKGSIRRTASTRTTRPFRASPGATPCAPT